MLTLRVDIVSCHKDQVSRLHLFLPQCDGQRVVHVRLVPGADPKAQVFLQVSHHTPHQTTAVQEVRGFVLRGWGHNQSAEWHPIFYKSSSPFVIKSGAFQGRNQLKGNRLFYFLDLG